MSRSDSRWASRSPIGHRHRSLLVRPDRCAVDGVLAQFLLDPQKLVVLGDPVGAAGGRFLWEQFHELAKLGADSVFVAMFDQATAIFKVTSSPPTQAHFAGYDGLPSDWYLRLVGEGGRMLRKERPISAEIPIKP